MRPLLLLPILLLTSPAVAGGPACGPGYCLDSDDNGCHRCGPAAQIDPVATPTGIPVNTAWKRQLYAFARQNVVHPAWGLAHSERDYRMTEEIARKEGIPVDQDALFAAAFLHDVGGIGSFAKKGVDHAVRSVEVIEPLLPAWGFPMEKWPLVKEMILGHTYYGPKPASPIATAFRDADVLDFLGNVGVARLLSITEEAGFYDGTLRPTVATLEDFSSKMMGNCSLASCRTLAAPRQAEMAAFLAGLRAETCEGKAQ